MTGPIDRGDPMDGRNYVPTRGRIRGTRRVLKSMFLGDAPADESADVSAVTSTLTNSSFAGSSGTLTYTAREADGTLAPNAPVVFTVDAEALVSASLSQVTVSPATIAADGVETATMSNALVDTATHPVVGVPAASVVEASTGSNNTLTAVDSVSNVSGIITTTVKTTTGEAKTLSATVMGLAVTDTAALTATGGSSWLTNKPAFVATLAADYNFASAGTEFTDVGSYGSATNVADATAPSGDGKVAKFIYPAGAAAGFGTGVIEIARSAGTLTLYVEYLLYIPTVYEVHPSNHKVTYHSKISAFKNAHVFGIQPGSGVTDYTNGALRWNMQTQTADATRYINTGSSAPVRGNWYKISELSIMNTVAGTGDGTYKVWIDDVLAFNYTNVTFAAAAETLEFRIAGFDPYYGGNTPGHTIPTQFEWHLDRLTVYSATTRS